MSQATPSSTALWSANSFAELHAIARAEGRHEGLKAPLEQLSEHGCPEDLVELLAGFDPETVEELLTDRRLAKHLRHHLLTPAGFKALFQALKQLLGGAAPEVALAGTPVHAIPRSAEALRSWAKESGIPDAIYAPLRVIEPLLDGKAKERLRQVNPRALVGDALLRREHDFHYDDRRSQQMRFFEPAAEQWLLSEAREAREVAAQEEKAAPRSPLAEADAALAPLVEKWLELRGSLRRKVAPTRPELVRQEALRLSLNPLAMEYRDPRPCMDRSGNELARVVLPLERWRDQPLNPRCDCAVEGICRHMLAAVDAMLAWVHSPGGDNRAQMRSALLAPPWGLTLQLLRRMGEQLQEGQQQAPTEQRLIWQLTAAQYGDRLKPVLLRAAKRGGGWVKGKSVRLEQLIEGHPAATEEDRRVAQTLTASSYDRHGALAVVAVRQLARSHKLYGTDFSTPLQVVEAEAELLCRETPNGFELEVGAGGAPLDHHLYALLPGQAALVLDDQRKTCFIIQASPKVLAAAQVLRQRGSTFPKEAGETIADELEAAGLPAALPPALLGERLVPVSAPEVFLTPLDGLAFEVELRVRPLAGGLPFPVSQGLPVVRGKVDGRRAFAARDFDQERVLAQDVWSKLALPDAGEGEWRCVVEGEVALALLRTLEALSAEGLPVQWPSRRPAFTRPARTKDLRMAVREGRDWFGLTGTLEVDGREVALAQLLEAARQKRRFVPVAENHFVELSKELLEQLAPVAPMVFDGKQGQEVSLAAAATLQQLAGELESFEVAPSFASLAEKMRAAGASAAEVPDELKAQLRPYQVDGFRWLSRVASWGAGACLADDMGLGKTLQALALLVERRALGPALVVAPTSVCFNWESEAKKFAPCLRVIRYHHVDRATALQALGPGDVLITSYGLLANDAEAFGKQQFSTLVLDEAHAVKNAGTRRARAARELSADFKLALSGTPIENHLGELWSLYRVLLPGLFGSEELFRTRFWGPIEREKDADRRKALAGMLAPFLLRRTKAEVAGELPPRTEISVPVALSAAERKLYDQARLAILAELQSGTGPGGQDRRFQVLAGMTKLRLLACHPRLHDEAWTGPASKLARLLELVEELREEGHRALVFSQFTKHLSIVREALVERGVKFQYLDGETPEAERRRRVEAFQAGDGELFLISLKAGGVGLNLTGADNVIHLDPWWNPAVEDQATDRAHRIGQTKPVTVYRLITLGTLEEAILSLHAEKRQLVSGVLEGSAVAAKLPVEELAKLLEASAKADDEVSEEPPRELTPEPETLEAAPLPARPRRQRRVTSL